MDNLHHNERRENKTKQNKQTNKQTDDGSIQYNTRQDKDELKNIHTLG